MLAETLFREAKLCYGFVRRDLGTGLLPVPGFTLASLLYRQASVEEISHIIPCELFFWYPRIYIELWANLWTLGAFLYGLLYLYTFVVANQIDGIAEDKVNKPDRPIASGATSLQAAKSRWMVLTGLYLGYSYMLGVQKWTLLWIATTIAHNFFGFSNLGPTKDGCMGVGCIAQLMAAWSIGGSSPEMGWVWTKNIALYMLWPIPLQDLRDVPGDKAAGRKTTPILMGDIPCTSFSSRVQVSRLTMLNYSTHLYLCWHRSVTGESFSLYLMMVTHDLRNSIFSYNTVF